MSNNQFSCLLLESEDGKRVTHSIQTMADESLPEGDITVAIKYFTLNYKDGMIINGTNNPKPIKIIDPIATKSVMMVNIVLNAIDPSDYQMIVSDINLDGSVNVLDVVQLVNIILN